MSVNLSAEERGLESNGRADAAIICSALDAPARRPPLHAPSRQAPPPFLPTMLPGGSSIASVNRRATLKQAGLNAVPLRRAAWITTSVRQLPIDDEPQAFRSAQRGRSPGGAPGPADHTARSRAGGSVSPAALPGLFTGTHISTRSHYHLARDVDPMKRNSFSTIVRFHRELQFYLTVALRI
jgi:hypothetical protein